MDGRDMLARLAAVFDAHDWGALPELLHPAFVCRYVHTGEEFDGDAWVRLNVEYPGFERFTLLDCVADGARAAGRSHVTARNGGTVNHFEVASFLSVSDGLIRQLTEVWTDVAPDAAPPRPS